MIYLQIFALLDSRQPLSPESSILPLGIYLVPSVQ